MLLVGAVICLEEGCAKATIQLAKNEKLPDGGIKSGFGTLSAYRVIYLLHSTTMSTHCNHRVMRVQTLTRPDD